MPKTQQRDILAQFRDLGSEALNRLSDVPGGSKVLEMANESRARLDEMQKRLRGLDELEKRVAKLERQLAAQQTKKATTSSKARASKSASPRRVSSAKKPPA